MADSSVVFFGYGELALAGIDVLVAAGARLSAVVVPGNRTGTAVSLVESAAAARGVPIVVQPPRLALEPFLEQLRTASPDVIVVWSYSMILPPAVLAIPPRGSVNVHGGLLPEYRGGHVMQWALVNGEHETGVTLHYMDSGVDTGPVIAQSRFAIEPEDDAARVREKLKTTGAELLAAWWPAIADGSAPRRAQDETAARYWRMRTPEDGLIDWAQPAERICRLVRALVCNEPGAYLPLGSGVMSVTRAQQLPRADVSARTGDVVRADAQGLRIAALNGDVLITEARIDGRRLTGAALGELAGALAAGSSR